MSRKDAVTRPPVPAEADEIGSLATELARAYQQMVRWYRDELHMTEPEADARARGTDRSPQQAANDLERIRTEPPDQVSWFDLERMVERHPGDAVAVWQEIKAKARDELASGHRTAGALDWDGGPWQRARFLAIRTSLSGDNPSGSGIEAALVDMAAEAFSAWLELSEQYQMLAGIEAEMERTSVERTGRWKPPHQTVAEHTERVQRMAEAAHQRFLRTVKALTDLRRAGPVYVGQAGQVNVASQQVNMSRPASEGSDDGPE